MLLAILAGLCMAVQDTLNALKVQALSRNHGFLGGIIDTFLWGATITGTTIAVFAFHGGAWSQKVAIVIFVTIGTLIGNWGGAKLGQKFVKDTENTNQDSEITQIQNRLEHLESITAAEVGTK
jgi:hypothetical protein